MEITTTILLATNLVNLGFIFLIFFRSRTTAAEKFLGITMIGATFWNFGHFSIQFFGDKLPLVVLYPYFASTVIASSFLAFSFLFPEGALKKNRTLIIILYSTNILVGILIFLPGAVIKNYVFDENQRLQMLEFGPFYKSFSVYIIFLFSASFLILIRKIKKAKGILRIQLVYIMMGALISTVTGVIANLALPLLGVISKFWLGPSSVVFFFLFSTYAILRHHLFNMRVIGTEIFSGLISLIFFIQILRSKSFYEFIFQTILFLLVLFFSIVLVRGTLREVKRLQELSEAKSEFISIASHQLRSPLTAVKGYVSLLADGSFGPVSDKIKETLGKVYASNERLIRLVEDLLNISRIEEGKLEFTFEDTDIYDIVQSIVGELSPLVSGKGLVISLKKSDLPKINADQVKIRQAILNLIDNAIKYTNSGSIDIALKSESRGAKTKAITIEIKDTGVGMTKDDIGGLFEKFHRGVGIPKIHTEGAGLGLYVAKKIVEAHDGRVWAESSGKGMGSTFYIELPVK